MAERWFFALWPDRAAREALAAYRAALIPAGARAAHPLDLHLTLRFLGELDADALARAEETARCIDSPPVPVRIDRLGHFGRSQVLWCGPDSPAPELEALVLRLEAELSARGFEPDPRPFRAHITLARRVGRPGVAAWPAPVQWTSRELVLAAGREGRVPRYAPRGRWPLGGAETTDAEPESPDGL